MTHSDLKVKTFILACAALFSACSTRQSDPHAVWLDSSTKLEFVSIPASVFGPEMELGKYEVTQAQWVAVMGSNPSFHSASRWVLLNPFTKKVWNGDWWSGCWTCPVELVDAGWSDVQQFLEKLNGRGDGYTYLLPLSSIWEYAARAGTTGEYGGTGDLNEMGWYWANSNGVSIEPEPSAFVYTGWFPKGSGPHPVGQKRPNAWGLYDMHGNVWELVSDVIEDGGSYKTCDTIKIVHQSLSGFERMVRGGSWRSFAYQCASSCLEIKYLSGEPVVERWFSGYLRQTDIGFRLARVRSAATSKLSPPR
jgi:formylglycine-generating enzyme required for sulfatase activity